MAFDLEPTKKVTPKASTDDMLVLGHLTAQGVGKPITRKLTKKEPIPREAWKFFGIAMGVIAGLAFLACMH